MKISKKSGIGIIDSDEDKERISYCPSCEEIGLKNLPQQRIYLPHELIDGKEPTDKELWKQCHYCGRVYPKYEQKYQSELGETVQTSDNPHDIGG
jgi:hypothetical protein